MDFMIVRDPITGLFEQRPIPSDEPEIEEEPVQDVFDMLNFDAIPAPPKRRGRKPK